MISLEPGWPHRQNISRFWKLVVTAGVTGMFEIFCLGILMDSCHCDVYGSSLINRLSKRGNLAMAIAHVETSLKFRQ